MRARLPSPALLVALLALLISMGGTGYAAVKIGTSDLANNAVTSPKIKNKTIRTNDLAPKTLAKLEGQDGAAGTARAYAYVKPDPVTQVAQRSKGMTLLGSPDPGVYCFRVDAPGDATTFAPVATPEYFESIGVNLSAFISFAPPSSYDCPAGTEFMVFTYLFTATGDNQISDAVAFTVLVP